MNDNTATLPSVTIQRAVAQTKDGIDASEACFICQKKLWLSVFFDEPSHDAEHEKGTEILTNIGKLFYTHVDDRKRGIYPLYYNGLGVAFKESRAARDATAKGGAKDEAEKIAQDKINEVGLGEGKKSLNPKNWGPDLFGLIAKVTIPRLCRGIVTPSIWNRR